MEITDEMLGTDEGAEQPAPTPIEELVEAWPELESYAEGLRAIARDLAEANLRNDRRIADDLRWSVRDSEGFARRKKAVQAWARSVGAEDLVLLLARKAQEAADLPEHPKGVTIANVVDGLVRAVKSAVQDLAMEEVTALVEETPALAAAAGKEKIWWSQDHVDVLASSLKGRIKRAAEKEGVPGLLCLQVPDRISDFYRSEIPEDMRLPWGLAPFQASIGHTVWVTEALYEEAVEFYRALEFHAVDERMRWSVVSLLLADRVGADLVDRADRATVKSLASSRVTVDIELLEVLLWG